jgi:outer membrane protein assembly factor BamB
MSAARRAAVVLATLLVSLALAEADDRPRSPRPPAEKKPTPLHRILADQLAEARQAIGKASWLQAARLLQGLLDRDEDIWLEDEGVGLRREAQRLLATLSPEGRKAYRELAGPAAARLLAKARTGKDDAALRQIVERYLHSDSGPEALALLARKEAEAGHHFEAAQTFALLEHRATADWPVEDLYRAARAYRDSGDDLRAEQMTQLLLDRLGRDTLRLGRRKLGRDELRQQLSRPAADDPTEWQLYRGDPRRTGQAKGNVPVLDRKWWMPTSEAGADSQLENRLKAAETHLRSQNRPVLHSAFPITAVGIHGKTGQPVPLVVCRGHGGIMGINALIGTLMWRQPATWSLESLLSENPEGGAARNQAIMQWLQFYIDQKMRPEIVFENSVIGSLSADSSFVYAVDDLAVPPPPQVVGSSSDRDNVAGPTFRLRPPDFSEQDRGLGGVAGPTFRLLQLRLSFSEQDRALGDEEMSKAVHRSVLYACSLTRSGALEWRLGEEGGELSDCLFLGPPLPLDGKLYLLVEKEQELRLVCVDPTAPDTRPGKRAGRMMAKVLWMQTLGTTHQKLEMDVVRRTTAIPLAFAEGVLVCPTYVGSVVGIDPLRKRLLWKYIYKQADKPKDKMAAPGSWKYPTPVVSDGKVVFTAPDTHELHCLSLREGARLWTVPQKDDDLCLAAVKDARVLVVTGKGMRGLSLASGTTAWVLTAGRPSGEGALVGQDYYLPVQEYAVSRKPGIAIIDVAAGRLLAFVPMQKRRGPDDKEYLEAPGNLLFTHGLLISQTSREISAYQQAAEQLKEIKKRLADNPLDPLALMDRAMLRLSQRDRIAAIEDLRKVLGQKPSEEIATEANAALYQALTDLVRSDFDHAEPYLKLYEEVCTRKPREPEKSPQLEKEYRRRGFHYHLLVGQGRERQGRLRDALRAYFGAQQYDLAGDLMDDPDDPHRQLSPEVWLRGRIRRLLEKATPAQRKELEEEIDRHRPRTDADPLTSLRRHVALLAPETAVGCAARLRLARQLMAAQAHDEADMLLQEVRRHGSTEQAAGAVHLLAELMLDRGLPADAAHYYRLLRRDFAEACLPGGKTGAEVWKDVAADKRLLPYLDGPARARGEARVRLEELERRTAAPMVLAQPRGEVLPFLQARDVGVVLGWHARLLLRSTATGEVLWNEALGKKVLRDEEDLASDRGRPDLEYHPLGTLLFLALGPDLVVADAARRQVLWTKRLLHPEEDYRRQNHFRVDRDLFPERWITFPENGWAQEVTEAPVVGPSVVCVRAEEGLLGLDPLTGKTLWKRTDVPRRASLFGDDSHVCLVERGEENRPVSTRVFRTADGSPVAAKDCSALYHNRLGVRGSRLLLGGKEGDKVTLRLYDVPAGKDVWRHSYPTRTILLHSTSEDFTGSVSPKGVVSVLDAATGKEVLHDEMTAEDLQDVETIHLLADASLFYLACNRPLPFNLEVLGGVESVLASGSGLWSVPINGQLYAFSRTEKCLRWKSEAKEQRLVMNHLAESPCVLLASSAPRPGFFVTDDRKNWAAALTVIDKWSGVVRYEEDRLRPPETFHSLLLTSQTGRLDFVGHKSRLTVEWKKGKDT